MAQVTKQRNLSQLVVFALMYGGSNLFKLGAVEPEPGEQPVPPVPPVQEEVDKDTTPPVPLDEVPIGEAVKDEAPVQEEPTPGKLPASDELLPDLDEENEEEYPEENTEFPESLDEDAPIL